MSKMVVLNAILSKTSLTLLGQRSALLWFWNYAFESSIYLINHMLTLVLQNQSPFECLFNHTLDYDFLRTFRCFDFSFLHPFHAHKLDLCSSPYVFLGYSSSHLGYHCLNLASQHICLPSCSFSWRCVSFCKIWTDRPTTGHSFPIHTLSHLDYLPKFSLMTRQTPHLVDIWSMLETTLASPSNSRIMQLHSSFQDLRQNDDYASIYLHKANALFDEPAAGSRLISLAEFNLYVFRGLCSDFKDLVTSLPTRDDPISYTDLHNSCCNSFLGPRHKKKKIQKNKYIKNNSSKKRMPECLENGQKLVEEVQKYKDWNLTVYSWPMRALLMMKIWFEEEKSKIKCL